MFAPHQHSPIQHRRPHAMMQAQGPTPRKATYNPFGHAASPHARPTSPPTPPESDDGHQAERGPGWEEGGGRSGEFEAWEPPKPLVVSAMPDPYSPYSPPTPSSSFSLPPTTAAPPPPPLHLHARPPAHADPSLPLSPYSPTFSPLPSPTSLLPAAPISLPTYPLRLNVDSAPRPRPHRRRSSARHLIETPASWLALYFAFNLGLTLYNKGVLVRFPFPYTLTAVHALCGSLGCWAALEMGYFVPARLTPRETLILAAFSVLYTINIAVSNLSLQLVTVPFHQVVRAATPLFTLALSGAPPGAAKLLSLLPVVAGVGLATYGDYYFTAWGLLLTLFGTFLAACKTIVTNVLQSAPSSSSSTSTSTYRTTALHPLDLLLRMSPLAFIQCVLAAYCSGELEKVRRFGARDMSGGRALALGVNGVIAFGLNVVSFTANKKTGPLTMTVAANVKQVLTIVLAVIIFDLTITPTNLAGIVLTLAGGAWYGAVEYKEKRRRRM